MPPFKYFHTFNVKNMDLSPHHPMQQSLSVIIPVPVPEEAAPTKSDLAGIA